MTNSVIDAELFIATIFDYLQTLFTFMIRHWILSIFILVGLLNSVVSIYRTARNK